MFKRVDKSEMTIPAKYEYLGQLRDFVTKIGKRWGYSDKVISAFKLSADEAATNIIKHAYRDTEGDITKSGHSQTRQFGDGVPSDQR
ncbi:MAG: ATP-binding protein [candidate division KSB1 bacterium]|nr:ATP-binding protein [candidate division KSB1 bacterium]